MRSENKNTVLTKEEIRKKQESLSVLKADLSVLSDNNRELHSEVFDKSFIRRRTLRYKFFRDFIDDSPSKIRSGKLQNAEDIDNFVRKETVFDDWNQMKEKAIEEWIANNANLD